MQIQPAPARSHLPHPITVVTGRRKPLELDLAKAQQPYGQYSQYTYPSPPMTSPPSPPRTYVATSRVTEPVSQQATDPHYVPGASYPQTDITSSIRREPLPATSLPLPTPSGFQHHAYSPSPHLAASAQGTIAGRNYFPQRAAIPASGQGAVQISEIGRSATPLKTGRSSRRGKTHVQKACVNCKKAHLSCDAQRPCARCVTSGKQDTCHDVEHKKRGRPRLRDERESRLGREIAPTEPTPVTAQPFPPTAQYATEQPSGHRRTQSGRVLRHRSSIGQQAQPPSLQRHTIGGGLTPLLGRMPAARVYTNLSFRILRTNKDFLEQFTARGAEVRGRDFSDFVEPRHSQDLQRLGTELRNEREHLDPMALPTIFSDQEQEAIDSVDEANIDAYMSNQVRVDTWNMQTEQGNMPGRPVHVQLGQVRTNLRFFPFVLFTMPYTPAPPQMPSRGAQAFPQSFPPPWEMGYQVSPGGYPQPGSGPATPALSLQSLAATLPPTSVPVGVSSYGISPRYPSGSSEYFPLSSASQRTSLQSPTTQYSQTPYYPASSNAGTRPQSTASEPPGAAAGSSSSRRPATYHGQARTFDAIEEAEPMPSFPSVSRTASERQPTTGDDDDGRKRRRLNIKELTD